MKIISCCGCDVTFSTVFVVLHLNTSSSAFVCAVPFSAGPHSVRRGEIACLDLVVQIIPRNQIKNVPHMRVPGTLLILIVAFEGNRYTTGAVMRNLKK